MENKIESIKYNGNQYMNVYQYYDRYGNKYNCRTGYTGRYMDLTDMDFLSENEITMNTKNTIKEQNHLHTYKGAIDYIDKKSAVFNILGSITKIFRFF